MITITDRLMGPVRGSTEQAIAFAEAHGAKRLADVVQFIHAAFRYAPAVGLDPAIVVSQSAHETGNWTSRWWTERFNATGLGITGDPAQDAASGRWANGEAAALGQLAHLAAYCGIAVHDWLPFDPRYPAMVTACAFGSATTIADLAGRWATDTRYAEKIAAKGNAVFPGIVNQEDPMAALTFGRASHPAVTDRPITKAEGRGQNNLGKRSVTGVVWHRVLGALWDTDAYFRQPTTHALTDYGVGVASIDGDDNDGAILRWNDPLGWQSGWASGPVSSPYGDGLAFLQDHDWDLNIVNRDQASIEISGHQTTPLTPKSRHAIAAITAYWADQARIPWDAFPIIPGTGYSFVRWHEEFTWGTGKRCPFAVVKRETADLIELTRAILREAQTETAAPVPPRYAPLNPPDFLTPRWITGGEDAAFPNGVKVFSLRRRWQARVETRRLQATHPESPEVGPPLPAGRSTIGVGLYHSHGEWWVLTEWGERLAMDDMTDRMIPGYWDQAAA